MGSSLSLAELSILDWIAQHCHSGFGDVLMPLITKLGDKGLFWIAVGLALLVFGKARRSTGIQILLALLLSLIFCNLILKNAVGRIRPCDLKPVLELLVSRPHDPSFPSGHTSASFAAAVVLWRTKCPGWQAAFVLAFLIAFSRLYLYVHFPTDVLCGLLLGTLCGLLAVFLWKQVLVGIVFNRLLRSRTEPPETSSR